MRGVALWVLVLSGAALLAYVIYRAAQQATRDPLSQSRRNDDPGAATEVLSSIGSPVTVAVAR